ncbi:hypothetical protein LAZ67_3001859 [Cordylochernes scorpioides]|uniref:Uncharacterized protein n=1 Tax=Cordylochernes scorpioides TaxID=51811 RepID=A0ABY6KBZ8_9ARAC|nr:hypothetical protein LAZ67_3001859 [Cordylochernes scorpioides]
MAESGGHSRDRRTADRIYGHGRKWRPLQRQKNSRQDLWTWQKVEATPETEEQQTGPMDMAESGGHSRDRRTADRAYGHGRKWRPL